MHYKDKHGLSARFSRYCCSQGQCCRTFSDKYVFKRHLERCHSHEFVADDEMECTEVATDDDDVMSHVAAHVAETDSCVEENVEGVSITKSELRDMVAIFICELKSKISTLTNVQSVVKGCQHLFEVIIDDLMDSLKPLCADCETEQNRNKWNDLFQKMTMFRNPFQDLESEAAQISHLEEKGVYVNPESYTVGSKQVFMTDKRTGMKKPSKETVTGHYVSIRKTMVALAANSSVLERATINHPSTNNGSYQSFVDGEHWKQHQLHNHDVIVIRLYGDDFEPANPLGSRKSAYKVGCIYYQFENLPAHELSRTDSMFLALCYHSGDVKEFGWDNVLRPMIIDLQWLENHGIDLEMPEGKKHYQVMLSVVTGDNLFLNSILGFVESFVASYPCRHCHLHRSSFCKTLVENKDAVRTVESYEAALMLDSVQDTGIKRRSALNDLKYFHAAENYVQDIMHDVFEGVCAYDIPLVCSALIQRRFFDLAVLNCRLQQLTYSSGDSRNKPPVISTLSVEMLPFEASQMWCITRMLSFAVGELVPEDNDVWQFYLLLRNIVDLILAPVISTGDVNMLSVIISEYLETRKRLFPEHTVKNKHHHLTHYPMLIKKVGPLSRLWCMRFESKHQRAKKLLHISGNFKNIPKSCAVRHQLDLAYRLMKEDVVAAKDTVIGSGCVVTLSDLSDGSELNSVLGNVGLFFELFEANWIEVKGTKYQRGCTVLSCLEEDDNIPVFMTVQHIFVRDGNIMWLVGERHKTQYFDSHFHAYLVLPCSQNRLLCVSPSNLLYYWPVTVQAMHIAGEEQLMIGLRHRI